MATVNPTGDAVVGASRVWAEKIDPVVPLRLLDGDYCALLVIRMLLFVSGVNNYTEIAYDI